jgi:hypothetical protein
MWWHWGKKYNYLLLLTKLPKRNATDVNIEAQAVTT